MSGDRIRLLLLGLFDALCMAAVVGFCAGLTWLYGA